MMISKGFKWATWKKDQFVGWWYHLFFFFFLFCFVLFCFSGRLVVFSDLNTLDQFASFSDCKVNMSKSGAIHIGSLKNSDVFPFQDSGLRWKSNTFKTLGIIFSLNVTSLYDLNFVLKLRRIEQTLNCWKHRNLSLIGAVTVIKSLLLPQLLYLFSMLCINIPKTFFSKSWIIFFISLFGMVVMIGLNVIFFVMTMIMVVCGCLIHFIFPSSKIYLG